MLLALPSSPCQKKRESPQALQTSGSSEQSQPAFLKKTARYSYQINLFYKAKNAPAHQRSVFLVFATASHLTRRSVRKNTAKPKPSKKEKFEINGSRTKYSKVVFTKSITAQKMKARTASSVCGFFSFWVCIFKKHDNASQGDSHTSIC